jgi:hypothetical protein
MTRMPQPIDTTEHIAPSFEADGTESWQSTDTAIATPAVPVVPISGTAITQRAITGTDDDDELAGTAGDDSIHGLAGNDSINGQAGNDRLFGEEGNDILYGMAGNDSLISGDGDDVLEGELARTTSVVALGTIFSMVAFTTICFPAAPVPTPSTAVRTTTPLPIATLAAESSSISIWHQQVGAAMPRVTRLLR